MASRTRSAPAGVSDPSESGSGTVMTSSRRCSKTRFRDAGTNAVTYPAPARIAASAARQGAPVRPSEPPHTRTVPDANFVPSTARRGMRASASGPIRPTRASTGAPSGIPMSTTRTSPACALPGLIHRPGLEAWKVTVTSARTAAPATSPFEAFTPLGTSTATTGQAARLSCAIAPATGSRGSPSNPVPKSASTATSAPSRAPAASGRGAGPGRRSRLAAASPRNSSGGAVSMTSTSRPCSRSRRAATRPSPPLLPFPHTTATVPAGARSATARATPAPARSISSSEGTPCSSIAQASIARIWSASKSGSSQSGRAMGGC